MMSHSRKDKTDTDHKQTQKQKKKFLPALVNSSASPIVNSGEASLRKLKRKFYEKELIRQQFELVKMQYWLQKSGQRLVIIFEGRDAAGKGGLIQRIIQPLNPRGVRLVALGRPSDVERTQWYFQRYVAHLPSVGEIVIFDRSWYNRAGVERVMRFCSDEQATKFLAMVPAVEKAIIES